ncbi:MAG: response regulator [Bacteroidetes bacterium]|nr:MAG: response regulator [Bacteroidota bacterium]
MNRQNETTRNVLEVIPDILLWIDNNGKLLDYHPNNHAFLFDREGGVVGRPLEEVFNRDLSTQILELAAACRKENKLQAGELTCRLNGSVSRFECRIAVVDNDSLIAGWREITHLSESRKGELIKGNNKATLVLLTESSLDEAIVRSFEILGTTYQADRITLFRNHFDPDTGEVFMTLQQEWSHAEITRSLNNLQFSHVPYHPDFSRLYNSLQKNAPVIAIAEDLTAAVQKFLAQMEIRSVVIMPVNVRNLFWGFLGIGDCRSPRVWKEEEIGALKAISVILGAVIQKHQDQEELTIARLRAEESDRLKTSILANINHELRTPMTGILGFSEILCECLEQSETRLMAKNIQISGRRLLATLNSMIELSQFEAKKALFKLMETKLNELILMACEPHITAAKQKKLGFEIYMNESIFSFIDENLFTQMLNHILENAVKFTHSGTITVETGNEWDAGKTWSCIRVKDTGQGIPEEFHELIFEEFRQVSEGYNRSFEGSGLGLTLSKKIVELMNGRLTLTSHPDQGSTFTIWLPSSQVSSPDFKSSIIEAEILPEVPEFPVQVTSADLPSILVVEDNRLNSDLIQIYLRNQYNCDVAGDGEMAVEMSRNKQYASILMDINLGPGIDGMETTRRIRTLSGYSHIPIIAVTGYTMDSDKEEIINAGCSHYLAKPINKTELSTLITSLVGKKEPRLSIPG